jgi:universal stress protein A
MNEPPPWRPERLFTNVGRAVVKLRRILVPVDFRGTTVEALRYAAAFAREYKATIILLHVVVPDGSHVRRNISKERLIDELREVGESQIRHLVDVIWGDDIVVASGKPDLQIVNGARETKADMIIMASHGTIGSWGFFRRSTMARVVRTAPCPVLVVPAFERGFVMTAETHP